MLEKITLKTNLEPGSRLKKTYSNDRIEYYTVYRYDSFIRGYELKFDGINTGEEEGLVLYATQLSMWLQGWEIEK